jgi:uncharacterized lipoprotein YbaY
MDDDVFIDLTKSFKVTFEQKNIEIELTGTDQTAIEDDHQLTWEDDSLSSVQSVLLLNRDHYLSLNEVSEDE